MADGVFHIAKGRINEIMRRVNDNDPTNAALIITLLQASNADATLEEFDDLSTLLADAGNTEATFTNFARQTLTDTDVSEPVTDDTNDRQDADIPDITFSSAGGTTDNTLVKLIVAFDSDTTAGDDTNIVPLTHHDFAVTTNGTDIVAQINSAGFFRAS